MVIDDENKTDKNLPATNKKESTTASVDETEKQNDSITMFSQKYKNKTDIGSNSGSFSNPYSARSRLNVSNANSGTSKLLSGKRCSRRQKWTRNKRISRRAHKRRRPVTRRRNAKRAPRRKLRDKTYRDSSTSSIFSNQSSLSRSLSPLCKYCRCVTEDRYLKQHQSACRRTRDNSKTSKRRKKIYNSRGLKRLHKASKGIQVGSRSIMFSRLFVNEGLPTPATLPENKNSNYNEITPEMIYQCVRILTMWRQNVNTQEIYDYLKVQPEVFITRHQEWPRTYKKSLEIDSYIFHGVFSAQCKRMRRNYPVNQDDKELQEELEEKLRVASIVGLLVQVDEDLWCLNCALMNRQLFDTHVSKFWELYVDTLKPIDKRNQGPAVNKNDDEEDDNIGNQGALQTLYDNMYL